MAGAFRHEDEGPQFHAVAHGDHLLALHVIEGVGDGRENFRRVAGQVGRNSIGARSVGQGMRQANVNAAQIANRRKMAKPVL